jgi:hypothetical protein
MRLAEARELVDLLDGAGRHDRVAVLLLERWLRARGYQDEADQVALHTNHPHGMTLEPPTA